MHTHAHKYIHTYRWRDDPDNGAAPPQMREGRSEGARESVVGVCVFVSVCLCVCVCVSISVEKGGVLLRERWGSERSAGAQKERMRARARPG